MRNNSLTPNKGLSLSQAQSISNLCNQRAREITNQFNSVNNYSKTVEIFSPKGEPKTHVLTAGIPLPPSVAFLLKEKAELHACQAFLMENIKAKDAMLNKIKQEQPDFSNINMPVRPLEALNAVGEKVANNLLKEVKEEWGWEQLTAYELNEYLEAEAYASHIGQFIHKDGILDQLRRELPKVPSIDWIVINEGVKTPVDFNVHHTNEELLELHEELAAMHRQYEQRVNYFKAKVKNLVTAENARIAKINADLQNEAEAINNKLNSEYDTAVKAYNEKIKTVKAEFEKVRQERIKEVAAMRIQVDPRFQKTIDMFMNQLSDEQE